MAKIFQKVAVPTVHHSNFNLTHEHKTSFRGGYLIPIDCVECLPNDTFHGSTEAFIRLAPMQYPVMHRLNLKTYTFFVPNRIIWKYWQQFIAEDKEDVAPAMLTMDLPTVFDEYNVQDIPLTGTLLDYFGLPVIDPYLPLKQSKQKLLFSLLPFLAYQKIYDDYFRDENLLTSLFDVDSDDNNLQNIVESQGFQNYRMGDQAFEQLFTLRKKAWEKDYFTSALPDPQYGQPVPVPVSIGANSNLRIDGATLSMDPSIGKWSLSGLQEERNHPIQAILSDKSENTGLSFSPYGTPSSPIDHPSNNLGKIVSEGSNLSLMTLKGEDLFAQGLTLESGHSSLDVSGLSFTINDLRLASAIQRFQELLMRGGHRYKETILTMFNQITPDYRLDRPEFICSQTQEIQISDIPQTSATQENSAQGNLAGKGLSYGVGGEFKYHCQEHGFLITIACILPRTSYCNGISRMWTRENRYDYFTPAFEELGEQEIKRQELYLMPTTEQNEEAFGYAPRYSEYKYLPSKTTGEFRTTLDFMTMSRKFTSAPYLNPKFVEVDEETINRPFANTDYKVPKFYADFVLHLKARRPMQYNPIPRLV